MNSREPMLKAIVRWILGGLLAIFALLIPVGMLPQASFEQIPAEIPLETIVLFVFLPI